MFKNDVAFRLIPNKLVKALAVVGLLSFIPLLCSAELHDPTKPENFKPTTPHSEPVIVQERLILSAIWITASGKWATINGITAKEGQTILNKIKIIKISANTVSLSDNGHLKTLPLLTAPSLNKSQ